MGKGIWFKQNFFSVLSEKCVPRTGTVQNFRFVFLFVSVGRATKLTIFFFVFFLLLRFEQINNKIVKQFSHFPRRRRSRCCRRICSFLFFKSFWGNFGVGWGGVCWDESKTAGIVRRNEPKDRRRRMCIQNNPCFCFPLFSSIFLFSDFPYCFPSLLYVSMLFRVCFCHFLLSSVFSF